MGVYREIYWQGQELAYLSNEAYDAWKASEVLSISAGTIALERTVLVKPQPQSTRGVALTPEVYSETKRLSSDSEAAAKRVFDSLVNLVGDLIGPEQYAPGMNPDALKSDANV